jgi:hypothetical protein
MIPCAPEVRRIIAGHGLRIRGSAGALNFWAIPPRALSSGWLSPHVEAAAHVIS